MQPFWTLRMSAKPQAGYACCAGNLFGCVVISRDRNAPVAQHDGQATKVGAANMMLQSSVYAQITEQQSMSFVPPYRDSSPSSFKSRHGQARHVVQARGLVKRNHDDHVRWQVR
jgi:hypothetical protein